jgi:ornithine carbamoyltransferase
MTTEICTTNQPALAHKDLLSIDQLSAEDLHTLFGTTTKVKANVGAYSQALGGKSIVMLFEKPSLRTRVSFEIGLTKIGAHVMYFDHAAQRIGERESVKDYAKNLERYADCLIARTFSHDVLGELAEHATIPVINALSDHEHPCQALADMFTLSEHLGSLSGARLAWIGDGNNVCHSLLLAAAKLGVHFTAITPKGFEPQFSVLQKAINAAEQTGATIHVTNDLKAVKGHHAVYTDTWISMGQAHQAGLRADCFVGFQVDEEVMAAASHGIEGQALFMHCLPAHRGEEVVDEVIDSPASVVYDQAENRMHVQNALLMHLMGAA